MHIDIPTLLAWAPVIFRWLQEILGFGKGALETAKTAKELFEGVQEQVSSKDEKEQKAGIERAHILSELLRSYALFGFLEYLYRTTMALLVFLMMRQALEILRQAKRQK